MSFSASGSRKPRRSSAAIAAGGVLDPPLGQGDAGQADLGLGQVWLERQRLAILGLGGPGSESSSPRACAASDSASVGRSRSIQLRITDSGWTPTKASIAWPSRTPKTAGIDRTPNWPATSGLRSMSTLASTNLPSYSCASFSRTGPSIRHGPHHAAQKSTTTGTVEDRSMISRSKVSDVTSMTFGEDEDVAVSRSCSGGFPKP